LLQESSQISRLGMDMIKALMLQLFITVARQSENKNPVLAPNYNYTLLQSFRKLNRYAFCYTAAAERLCRPALHYAQTI
jgi:hypothetical protein